MNKKPLELNEDFKYALDVLEKTDKNIFITGRAGTGKSTLLQLFRQTTRKNVVVLAPTGIAALNVQGQTIHSFFGFSAKILSSHDIKRRKDRRIYENLDVLIIDEISMVRADLLDQIDLFLRVNRDNMRMPFGGVQVVFFGDMFQLPPVVASQEEQQFFRSVYESPFFFSAKVFEQPDFLVEAMELNRVYRQEARQFIRLLDAVRLNQMDYDDLDDLNMRHVPDFNSSDYYITLSTRNAIVDSLNERALQRLDTLEVSFIAEVGGSFEPKQFPTELALRLKLGAQVMFIKNDPKREYVNGTIGKIVQLKHDKIVVEVETRDGTLKDIEVERQLWEITRYKLSDSDPNKIDTETIGSFKQYPLRLAWAITIHKSQGKTFDKVIIDLGTGSFKHGQTYVALSRCRTLEGIVLRQKIRPQDVIVDERIIDFYERFF